MKSIECNELQILIIRKAKEKGRKTEALKSFLNLISV